MCVIAFEEYNMCAHIAHMHTAVHHAVYKKLSAHNSTAYKLLFHSDIRRTRCDI